MSYSGAQTAGEIQLLWLLKDASSLAPLLGKLKFLDLGRYALSNSQWTNSSLKATSTPSL